MSLIQFVNASKLFSPANDGITDISFSVEPGELIVLTGPSGSGKTTLLKLITREYHLNTGEIIFHDQVIEKIKTRYLPHHRRKVGVIYQDYRLIPDLSVFENIALPLQIVNTKNDVLKKRVNDLLSLVKMEQKIDLFPSQLSGGEAQRVSIARALALAPDIIFADEPTGNLDSETSLHIAQLLRKINELGTTIIFATHDTSVIKYFQDKRQIKIKNGKLIEDSQVSQADKQLLKTDKSSKSNNSKQNSKSDSQDKKNKKDK